MAIEMLRGSNDLGTALELFAGVGHNTALGLVPLGHGDGWIEYRMAWRPELTGDPAGELIDPGAIYSLLDTTCSLTPWARLGRFMPSRSEEHTSELQSLMRISYAVFCLKKKKQLSKD